MRPVGLETRPSPGAIRWGLVQVRDWLETKDP